MMDELFDVSNKICIVTGGLGQIGKNMAKALYDRDARVAIFAATLLRNGWRTFSPPVSMTGTA